MGLYRLCLGHTADNRQGRGFLVPILSSLLTFLGDAIIFRPQQSSEVSACVLLSFFVWGGVGGGGGRVEIWGSFVAVGLFCQHIEVAVLTFKI